MSSRNDFFSATAPQQAGKSRRSSSVSSSCSNLSLFDACCVGDAVLCELLFPPSRFLNHLLPALGWTSAICSVTRSRAPPVAQSWPTRLSLSKLPASWRREAILGTSSKALHAPSHDHQSVRGSRHCRSWFISHRVYSVAECILFERSRQELK